MKQRRTEKNSRALIVWLIRVLVSGTGAFLALNLFSLFYYTVPAKIHSESQATDYAWEEGSFHSRLTEGFGTGFIDKNGYNNTEGLAENPAPDVLVTGSSHVEAFQILQTENLAYVLDAQLRTLSVYSMGVSGHSFLTCAKNYERALQMKKPKYTVMETDTISFRGVDVDDAVNGVAGHTGTFVKNGVIQLLSRIPWLRLLYMQLENIRGEDIEILSAKKEAQNNTSEDVNLPAGAEQLHALIGKINTTATENGVMPVIFYHPHLTLNSDGTVTPQTDETDFKNFADACKDNNVIFVDLTDTFLNAWYGEHILPHGFFNTEIGTGHLNVDGHRMAATQLADVIIALERGRTTS